MGRVTVVGLVALVMVCGTPRVVSPRGVLQVSDAESSGPATEWLHLEYRGGCPPPAAETLTVDQNGVVTVTLGIPRDSSYIGVFRQKLTPHEIVRLKALIARSGLDRMSEHYRSEPRSDTPTWVELTVKTEALEKKIRAENGSLLYPWGLANLFDLHHRLPGSERGAPGGMLSNLIQQTARSPLAAISVDIELPARTFRTGEGIPVQVVVRNVGTEPVLVPTLECEHLVRGEISVHMRRYPPSGVVRPPPHGRAGVGFGPGQWSTERSLGAEETADLTNLQLLQPGEEWRVRMTPEVWAASPGDYEIGGLYHTYTAYDRAVLSRERGGYLVLGFVPLDPVRISVE